MGLELALALAPTALAIVAPIVGFGYSLGLKFLNQHNLNTTVYEAVGRAGGVAYNALVASGKPATDPNALKAAAAAGAEYLVATIPDALKAKGVANPAVLAGAELGKLLASDPGLTPGKP